jgi:hypothetical protein
MVNLLLIRAASPFNKKRTVFLTNSAETKEYAHVKE